MGESWQTMKSSLEKTGLQGKKLLLTTGCVGLFANPMTGAQFHLWFG